MKGKEKEKCNHHLPLSWVPHQSNSPGVRRMTHSMFYRWALGRDSHRLTHLSVTQMFCLVFCSQQGNSSALLGITSRCSTKERLCYPTESKQTAPPCIWGHSATVQIRKGLAHTIFVMVPFEVQKHIRHNTIEVLNVFINSQKLTNIK